MAREWVVGFPTKLIGFSTDIDMYIMSRAAVETVFRFDSKINTITRFDDGTQEWGEVRIRALDAGIAKLEIETAQDVAVKLPKQLSTIHKKIGVSTIKGSNHLEHTYAICHTEDYDIYVTRDQMEIHKLYLRALNTFDVDIGGRKTSFAFCPGNSSSVAIDGNMKLRMTCMSPNFTAISIENWEGVTLDFAAVRSIFILQKSNGHEHSLKPIDGKRVMICHTDQYNIYSSSFHLMSLVPARGWKIC